MNCDRCFDELVRLEEADAVDSGGRKVRNERRLVLRQAIDRHLFRIRMQPQQSQQQFPAEAESVNRRRRPVPMPKPEPVPTTSTQMMAKDIVIDGLLSLSLAEWDEDAQTWFVIAGYADTSIRHDYKRLLDAITTRADVLALVLDLPTHLPAGPGPKTRPNTGSVPDAATGSAITAETDNL